MASRRADDWSAAPFVPESRELDVLAEAPVNCTGYPLHVDTTQTMFGAGSADATIILVGEQPGDREDRAGQPFVGPAGRVLQECLDDAGIVRDGTYTTNAVKHFQHERRGSSRLHRRPTTAEVDACHPWLDAELAAVPDATTVVALGATAARGLLGTSVPI
nr:uracil-DNA glycosylase [Acidimicrobiia bacterium]